MPSPENQPENRPENRPENHPEASPEHRPEATSQPFSQPSTLRRRRLFAVLCTAVLALVWIHSAWTADDAYITFRSVEQLVEGNGPRWNPHERVQAFTHPLWFGALAAGRIAFSAPPSAAAALSFFLTLGLFLVVGRRLQWRPLALAAALVLLLGSRAFVDFSSSGLEDPLSHFLLVLFVLGLLPAAEVGDGDDDPLRRSAFLGGLLLLCRHDLLLIILPPLVVLVARRLREDPSSWKRVTRDLVSGVSPFLAWTLFSVVYYGFPFPNTAYAKLNTGIEAWVLWRHGIDYLVNALRWDPLTPLVILVALGLGWKSYANRRSEDGATPALACGILLYLLYIVRIGGDFMAGRFLSEPFVVALVLVLVASSRAALRASLGLGLVFLVAWPLSPIHVARDAAYASYEPDDPREHGIADERAFYTGRRAFDAFERSWPVAVWQARPDPQEHFEVGYAAYTLGLERIVVDRFGLADPLLARLPADEGWERVGHFRRQVPDGYLESLRAGENRVENEHIRRLYERLREVTQGPLFTTQRWRDIVYLNLSYRRPGCVDPPCRELVMHRLPPSLFAPLLPPGGGEITSITPRGAAIHLAGRLPYDDLEPEQAVRVFVPIHAEGAAVEEGTAVEEDMEGKAVKETLSEPRLISDGPAFTLELTFGDAATARRAASVICVASRAADRPWRLLASPNAACDALQRGQRGQRGPPGDP